MCVLPLAAFAIDGGECLGGELGVVEGAVRLESQ